MSEVLLFPLKSGAPRMVKLIQRIVSESNVWVDSYSTPLDIKNIIVNSISIERKYSGTSRTILEMKSLVQSILCILECIILEKNRNPVIMKKNATLLCPKWVYR